MEPDRATFEIQGPSTSDDEPQFFESISESMGLIVHGQVWVPLSRTRLEGNLSGTFQVLDEGRPTATCTSTNHQFVMSR